MAAHQYFNAAGKRLPGVTTVLGTGLGWSKDALLIWANREGLAGRDLEAARDIAAGIGTIVHAMIEASVKGETYTLAAVPEDMATAAAQSFGAWEKWKRANVAEVIASEVSIVSESMQCGGTADMVYLNQDGRRCMFDVKTGRGVYAEHVLQVAAYGSLWNEAHPDEPIEEYVVLRVDRDTGRRVNREWTAAELDTPCRAPFEAALVSYRAKRTIEDLLR